jgi:predicted PurR-regulated permease PerM
LSAVATIRNSRFGSILTATVLTILLLWLFIEVSHVVVLLFLAILISLYLGAVADFFSERLHLPRRSALPLAIVVTLAAVVGLFWLLVPPVVQQTQALFLVLPDYITAWDKALATAAAKFPVPQGSTEAGQSTIVGALYAYVTTTAGTLIGKVPAFVHAAISVFSVAIMALYLARDPAPYREWLIAFFPPVHRDLVRDVLHETADTLRRWIVGQLLAMLILAVFTAIGLYLLEVPFWLPFGIFTGVVAIVPFFGTLVSTVVPALFVLGGPGFHGIGPGGHALLVVLLGTVIHLIESNVVMPLITANKVKLPPVLTIMSVLIVGKLLGPVGLLVAVPTLAVVMVVVRRILVNRIYEGQGFRRTARDRTLMLRVPAPEASVLAPAGPPIDPISILERESNLQVA